MGELGVAEVGAGIVGAFILGGFALYRWSSRRLKFGDGLRGEHINILLGVSFCVLFAALMIVVLGAKLFGVTAPRWVVFVFGWQIVIIIFLTPLSSLLNWWDRRSAARRDAQLGIEVPPRRIQVETAVWIGGYLGLFLCSFVMSTWMLWMTLQGQLPEGAMKELFGSPIMVIGAPFMVIAPAALAGYWQWRRRKAVGL